MSLCRVAQPALGDDGIVVVAEHLLEARHRLGERGRLGTDRRRHRLGGVARPLGEDAHLVEVRVGRVLAETVDAAAQASPRTGGQPGEHLGGGGCGGLDQGGTGGGGDEVVEQAVVAGVVHGGQQGGTVGVTAVLEVGEESLGGGAVAVGGQGGGGAAQALQEHVG